MRVYTVSCATKIVAPPPSLPTHPPSPLFSSPLPLPPCLPPLSCSILFARCEPHLCHPPPHSTYTQQAYNTRCMLGSNPCSTRNPHTTHTTHTHRVDHNEFDPVSPLHVGSSAPILSTAPEPVRLALNLTPSSASGRGLAASAVSKLEPSYPQIPPSEVSLSLSLSVSHSIRRIPRLLAFNRANSLSLPLPTSHTHFLSHSILGMARNLVGTCAHTTSVPL